MGIAALARVGAPFLALLLEPAVSLAEHPWQPERGSQSLAERIAPPAGFRRIEVDPAGFGAWLRRLPVVSGRPAVKLHTGALKANQRAHHVVLDIDVGRQDLQQCADAVMRLFAEYQWSAGRADEVCFRYTSGDKIEWKRWRRGERPKVRGNRVSWTTHGKIAASYRAFRQYLNNVFTYAGTASLRRDLVRVATPAAVRIGDVFIQGGFPGHAVLVVDVAEDARGTRAFILAQSYMPAQQIHVLRNPSSASPWYPAQDDGALVTPEWSFQYADLRRFSSSGCPVRTR